MPSRAHMPESPGGLKRLSSAEWKLMEICWRLCPAPVIDIHGESRETIGQRDFNTVSTLLKRMEVKGWLKFDRKVRRPFPASVLVDRETALVMEIEMFLDEIVGEDPKARRLLMERLEAR